MFKRNFERLCNAWGKSPTAVCVELGLSHSVYSLWTDSTVPRRATLQKIADYFGVTSEELLQDEKGSPDSMTESFTREEVALIESYRNSPENVRKAVKALLDLGG